MPAFADITVNDRESTPVAHTFEPRSNRNGVATWVESTSGVPAGSPRLSVSLRETAEKFKAHLALSVPIVVTETINGVAHPLVVRTSRIGMDVSFEKESTLQERKNAIGMFANALASSVTTLDGLLTGLEDIY